MNNVERPPIPSRGVLTWLRLAIRTPTRANPPLRRRMGKRSFTPVCSCRVQPSATCCSPTPTRSPLSGEPRRLELEIRRATPIDSAAAGAGSLYTLRRPPQFEVLTETPVVSLSSATTAQLQEEGS